MKEYTYCYKFFQHHVQQHQTDKNRIGVKECHQLKWQSLYDTPTWHLVCCSIYIRSAIIRLKIMTQFFMVTPNMKTLKHIKISLMSAWTDSQILQWPWLYRLVFALHLFLFFLTLWLRMPPTCSIIDHCGFWMKNITYPNTIPNIPPLSYPIATGFQPNPNCSSCLKVAESLGSFLPWWHDFDKRNPHSPGLPS